MDTSTLTSEMFRRVTGMFTTGVTVITVEREPGHVHGMTANSFTSVSLDPLLVLVCVDHDARLLSFLKAQHRFGVTILKAEQQVLSDHFAKGEQTPEIQQRLGIRFRWSPTGIPLLSEGLAHLTCNVVAEHPAGDHTIFIGEVDFMEASEGQPLLYHRGKYRNLLPYGS